VARLSGVAAFLADVIIAAGVSCNVELRRMKDNQTERIVRILGLGFDADDGHVRITRGDNFDILLGSETSHGHMQETCIKINEKLKKRGRELGELSGEEFLDLVSGAD
jgi:hypothetical protein